MKSSVAVFMCCVFAATSSFAQQGVHEQVADLPPRVAHEYLEVWLGAMDTDDPWSLNDPASNEDLHGDYNTMPIGGGVGQVLWGHVAQYGFEGGGLISWQNDEVEFAGTNNTVLIRIDNSLFMMDAFMGGLVGLKPTKWLRLYAAAGPSIAWGYLDGEDNDPDNSSIVGNGPNGFFAIDLDDSSSDFSFALYARAGIAIELNGGFTVGVSARYADHTFDFDDRGELELDQVQWLLTLGGRL
jgi:opacity protein-like surface antigen